jgi:hypothetical protein
MKNRAGLLPLTTTKKWLRSTLSTKNPKSNKILKTFLKQRISKTPRINSPLLLSVLISPFRTSLLTWESNLSLLMDESSTQSEDLFGNATCVGNNTTSMKIKLNSAPVVDTTVSPKYPTVWIPAVMLSFTEKKDGSLIKRFKSGRTRSTINNKRKRNINTKDVQKVIYLFNFRTFDL